MGRPKAGAVGVVPSVVLVVLTANIHRRREDERILQPRIEVQANRIYKQQQHIQTGAHSPAQLGPHAPGPQHTRVRLPALPLRLEPELEQPTQDHSLAPARSCCATTSTSSGKVLVSHRHRLEVFLVVAILICKELEAFELYGF